MSGNISVSYHCNRNVESTCCHILLYENKPFWHSDSDFLNQLFQLGLGFFFVFSITHWFDVIRFESTHKLDNLDPSMFIWFSLNLEWNDNRITFQQLTQFSSEPPVCTHCIYSVLASLNNWMIIPLMRWLFKKDVRLYIMNKLQFTKLFPCCVLLYNDKISLYWNVIQDKTE